jgi:hypothetical protein
MVLEVAALVVLVALLVLGGLMLFRRRPKVQRPGAGGAHWRAMHYDAKGVTRVVVRKTSATGVNLLNEHVVAELERNDPDYDTKFLEAMNAARQRQSAFEAEQH